MSPAFTFRPPLECEKPYTISEINEGLFHVTGNAPFEERKEVVEHAFESHGILVASTAGIEGADLSQVNATLAYDLPGSPDAMERLWGRFDRYGRRHPCVMYAFRDSSEAISLEAELLRLHGFE